MRWLDYSTDDIVFKAVQLTSDHIHLFGAVSLQTINNSIYAFGQWNDTYISSNDINSFAQLTNDCRQFVQMFCFPK